MPLPPLQDCPKCERRVRPKNDGRCLYCGAELAAPGFEEPNLRGDDSRRFEATSDEPRHYLLPEVGEPVELTAGRPFRLGRDRDAGLRIRQPTVSRRHAGIEWEGGARPKPVLRDLGSRCGTYLGDEPVGEEPVPIRSGDAIRLGAFRLLYLHRTPPELEEVLADEADEDTRDDLPVMAPASTRRLGPGAAPEEAPAPGPPARSATRRTDRPSPATGGRADRAAPTRRHGDGSAAPAGPAPARPRPRPGPRPRPSGRRRRPVPPTARSLRSRAATGRPARPAPAPAAAPPELPEGDLGATSPTALMTALKDLHATGVVHFEGEREGWVHLVGGKVRVARAGGRGGREAVRHLMEAEAGRYRFEVDAEPPASAAAPAEDLPPEGRLEVIPGVRVLRWIEAARLTGTLTVHDGATGAGEATFAAGECTNAGFDDLLGEEALARIERLQNGTYRFLPQQRPPTRPR